MRESVWVGARVQEVQGSWAAEFKVQGFKAVELLSSRSSRSSKFKSLRVQSSRIKDQGSRYLEPR